MDKDRERKLERTADELLHSRGFTSTGAPAENADPNQAAFERQMVRIGNPPLWHSSRRSG